MKGYPTIVHVDGHTHTTYKVVVHGFLCSCQGARGFDDFIKFLSIMSQPPVAAVGSAADLAGLADGKRTFLLVAVAPVAHSWQVLGENTAQWRDAFLSAAKASRLVARFAEASTDIAQRAPGLYAIEVAPAV